MSTSKCILYIEDNSDNRQLVRRLLQFQGYEMLEAANAKQALDILTTQRPDLILMDINMPEMDGLVLTQRIKTMPTIQSVPIIALTANVMRGDKERTLKAGCDGYIDKPIDVDRFISQITGYFQTE